MNPRLYLALAEAIVDDTKHNRVVSKAMEAAASRSTISRAYYAAFHVSMEFFDSMKLIVGQNASSHATLQQAMNNSGDGALKTIGSKLSALHTERLQADYNLARASCDQPRTAELAIMDAKGIVNGLDQLNSGSFDAVKVAATILNWATVTGKNIRSRP